MKMNRHYKPILCVICGVEVECNSSQQKYCKPCSKAKKLERQSLWDRKHRQKDGDGKRAYNRQYQHINLDKYRIWNHNRRARIIGNGGELPLDTKIVLFEQQEGFCYLCGRLLYERFDDQPTIEHKIPIVRGGHNVMANVGLAHASCNNHKYDKTEEEFLK